VLCNHFIMENENPIIDDCILEEDMDLLDSLTSCNLPEWCDD
jgi:hypothetical protein